MKADRITFVLFVISLILLSTLIALHHKREAQLEHDATQYGNAP